MTTRPLLFSLALTFALAAGCAAEMGDQPERGRGTSPNLGKADLPGSCAPSDCGGPSSTSARWCDELCSSYGDCCEDKVAVCDCAPVMCELYCENGFATDENGCEICACKDGPKTCGGFGGFPCPEGERCVDDPSDDCDPAHGGADCGGICEPIPADSCEGHCGETAADGTCWCDELCVNYGDCCDDATFYCGEVASGACVKNSLHACSTDADCVTGGCGGALCYNPVEGEGISTCECTAPASPDGCGCVAGQCAWYTM